MEVLSVINFYYTLISGVVTWILLGQRSSEREFKQTHCQLIGQSITYLI